MGQVLKKTANGYTWANESGAGCNIKAFEIDLAHYTQEEIGDIIGWINTGTDYCAVLKNP